MANEHLKRTPTSTGNRKVFTWSAWVKRDTTTEGFIFAAGTSNANRFGFIHNGSGADDFTFVNTTSSGNTITLVTERKYRDFSSWTHFLVTVDTTRLEEENRVRFYINGDEANFRSGFQLYPGINEELIYNNLDPHVVGTRGTYSAVNSFSGEMSDVFMVDGQALTPDVFGFYKDGNGYISAGSTQSTDFRPGQWVPKKPSVIKNSINNSGGFGVNGFYLPMNDSSNFGADFHCAPNSIIKLKGEDLPQPRNGAPTTTDAYVSQLRVDPYAANLVLAVPGIALENTNPELVTNGTFDTDISSWNSVQYGNGTITWSDGTVVLGGQDGTSSNYADLHQQVTGLTIGTRYYFSFETSHLNYLCRLGTTGKYSQDVFGIEPGTEYKFDFEFEATATTLDITFHSRQNSGQVYFDNISLKEAIPVRDYSADIKGSGSNRTPTATGPAGVGYEIPSYYGSAINTTGANDALYYDVDGSGSNAYGTDDFTFECWFYATEEPSNWGILLKHATNGSWNNGITLTSKYNTDRKFTIYTQDGSSNVQTIGGTVWALNQWHHVVAERYNGQLTLYVNGVAEATRADTRNYAVAGTPASSAENALSIGAQSDGNYQSNGYFQDVRVYKGVAKYKGGFDVPKPYTPVGIESWRTTTDTTANNFATCNPLNQIGLTFANGNLTTSEPGSSGGRTYGTMGSNTGKWYYEAYVEDVGTPNTGGTLIGINPLIQPSSNVQNRTAYRSEGSIYNDSGTNVGNSGLNYVAGDTIGVAWDADNKRLWFAKNNTWVLSGDPAGGSNPAITYTNTETQGPFIAYDNGTGAQVTHCNFGQNPTFSGQITAGTNADGNGKGLFKYQPPTGFLALCEDNLPTPAISDPGKHFKTVLWTGDGNSRSITGIGFKPDLVWIKSRTAGLYHLLTDSVRGVDNTLSSNTADNEAFSTERVLNSFDNDGFSLNVDDGSGYYGWNVNGQNMVAWCWKAGGAAVSNTDGTIASQVSVNQTAGFGIVTWTSTGSNDALQTVGHGLDTAPNLIILKNRSAAVNWRVYHSGINDAGKNSVTLNSSEAAYVFWPSVGSDTFGLANSTTTGQAAGTGNQDIVAYCWAEIEGFSKFGSYTGNGSADGPFVYCGFKPAFVMIKSSTVATNWYIFDNSRKSTNPITAVLFANTNDAETDNAHDVDFVSNGFKVRQASGFGGNNSGATYIFVAFTESPFKTANAK